MSHRASIRFGRAIALVAILVTFVALPEDAAAEPSTIAPVASHPIGLEWRAPPSCPDQTQVEARIYEHMGREGIDPNHTNQIAVRATISGGVEGHVLELEVETAAGATTSVASDVACDALAELVAIKVSLALDPVSTARALIPEPEPEPTTAPLPAAVPPQIGAGPTVAPPPPNLRARGASLLVQVGPVVGGGTLPSVEIGGLAAIGLAGPMWQTTLGFAVSSGPGQEVPEPAGGKVGMIMLLGELTACALPAVRRVTFPACFGFDAGAVEGRGIELASDRRGWSPILGVGVETGVTWPRDRRVRLLARARARVHVLRPSFSVRGLGEIHRTGVVGGQALVGVEVALGRGVRPLL